MQPQDKNSVLFVVCLHLCMYEISILCLLCFLFSSPTIPFTFTTRLILVFGDKNFHEKYIFNPLHTLGSYYVVCT